MSYKFLSPELSLRIERILCALEKSLVMGE